MFSWEKLLIKNFGLPDVIHTYGLWNFHNFIASKIATKYNIPHIIAPCGMLYEAAFKKSFIPKKIFWKLFQKSALLNANSIHAKSVEEFNNILHILPKIKHDKVIVLPNPIEHYDRIENNYETKFDFLPENKNFLLYVGRLDKRKGLIELIEVWNKIIKEHKKWCLVITGDDDGSGHLFKIRKKLNHLRNINYYDHSKSGNHVNRVRDANLVLTGALYDTEKKSIFCNANIFINPSNFENFGMTIAEALNYKLPVIISKNTPWKSVEKENCGWLLVKGNKNLESVLKIALKTSLFKLKQMGYNSSKLVRNLSQRKISIRTIALYEDLIKLS